jgi:predicted metalloprotease
MGGVEEANGSAERRLSLGAVGAGVAVVALVVVVGGVVLASMGVVGSAGDAVQYDPSGRPPVLSSDPQTVARELQSFWASTFKDQSRTYEEASIQPFSKVPSGSCSQLARNQVPFYCPADLTIYLNRGFLREVRAANGALAQAYVIAHLFGHHVQQVLGVMDKVVDNQLRSPEKAALLGRQLELEADCLAGYGLGDLTGRDLPSADEFRNAATAVAAVAVKRLKSAAGTLNPETWQTTSLEDQREWFGRGLALADVAACDTFSGAVTE